MKIKTTAIAAALCTAASAQNTFENLARPDGHAPISIMADHTHDAGKWMLSYRYMFMDMDGMYRGSNSISPTQVFNNAPNNYNVTPTRMTMEMHMLGAMYAPSDRITLSAMLPYLASEMDHLISPTAPPPLQASNGGRPTFTTRSEGIGDLKLGSLIRIVHDGPHHFHAGIGISLPTGSIAEKDVTPGPPMMGGLTSRQLPAAMQPGSGTFDLLPSLTYAYVADSWSAGIQAAGAIRTGENHHGYRLGNKFDLNSWIAYRINEWASVSTGISYHWEDELNGTQSDITRIIVNRTIPTAFSENYGGQRIEALAGVNFVIPEGILRNHRIAADIRVPLWQDRNGLGLGTDYTLTLGWQYAF